MDVVEILYSAVRVSTPLVFAAMGGLLTYQAGMLNIALDGFMIAAAFAGIATAYATGSLELALIAAVVYHALNGIRIIVIDFWQDSTKYQKQMWYGVMLLSAVILLWVAKVMLIDYDGWPWMEGSH